MLIGAIRSVDARGRGDRRNHRPTKANLLFLQLFLLLTLVPLVELMILFRIAAVLHWGPTLLLVIVTGVLGAHLARREGLRTIQRIQSELAEGHAPTDALVDALLILVAGLVLITPGVLTDLCGFGLLVPAIRRGVRRRLAEYFKRHVVVVRHQNGSPGPAGPDRGRNTFIDVEATSHDADEPSDKNG